MRRRKGKGKDRGGKKKGGKGERGERGEEATSKKIAYSKRQDNWP